MDGKGRIYGGSNGSSAPLGLVNPRSSRFPRARLFDLSAVLALLGAALGLGGAIVGLLPLFQRRAPCFHVLSPPDGFSASGASGPVLSWLPFGAQCTYFDAAGESVASVVPPWPSAMLVLGFALIVLGTLGIVRALLFASEGRGDRRYANEAD